MDGRNPPQPRTLERLIVSKSTTWARLCDLIVKRGEQPFVVTGSGARARRLIERLARSVADVQIAGRRTVDGGHFEVHVAIVNASRVDLRSVVWETDF